MSMTEQEGVAFLESLLNKVIRIEITDGRMFVGRFKCTDNLSNIILNKAFEYRPDLTKAVAARCRDAVAFLNEIVRLGLTGRRLGLIIVPGAHIVSIKLREGDSDEWGGD